MNKNAQLQTADQTLKGAVISLVTYLLHKNGYEPEFIALAIPVLAGLLAAVSTRFGNRHNACLFVPKDDDQPNG